MALKDLSETWLAIARDNLAAGVHAALTVSARSQRLLSPFGDAADKAHEVQRMVAEKVDAGVEGTLAAHAAWSAFLIESATGGVRSALDVSLGLAGVAEAAARPARLKVRANARRLTGF